MTRPRDLAAGCLAFAVSLAMVIVVLFVVGVPLMYLAPNVASVASASFTIGVAQAVISNCLRYLSKRLMLAVEVERTAAESAQAKRELRLAFLKPAVLIVLMAGSLSFLGRPDLPLGDKFVSLVAGLLFGFFGLILGYGSLGWTARVKLTNVKEQN